MSKHYWLTLGVIFLLSNCNEDGELALPIVQTGYVQQVGSSGATFHGKVLNQGSQPIIDQGFVWDLSPSPTIETSYTKSLRDNFTELFSASITSALIPGETYQVRAYVRNQDQTVYGRSVSFESLGSNAPRIIDFDPKIATWGDTITIQGENFSLRKGENMVRMGGYSSQVISEEEKVLHAIVPAQLDTPSVAIEISVLELKGTSAETFRLSSPEIWEFNPKRGTYLTPVNILGRYFSPGKTKAYFGEKEAEITAINDSTIMTVFPSQIPEGNVDLSVEVAQQRVIAEQKFFSAPPVITAIFPEKN